jgi:DNA (cytosine-5)-methyltransferase 1
MNITAKHKERIIASLNSVWSRVDEFNPDEIPKEIQTLILSFSQNIDRATSAFTNIVTCLVCCLVDPNVDPRYHRSPKKEMPKPPNGRSWFAGRTISEDIIYPWMTSRGMRTAKSGWQTRTFERLRPYTLNYPENISHIKNEFLGILDAVANQKVSAEKVLTYFFYLERSENNVRQSAINSLQERIISTIPVLILTIINSIKEHFDKSNNSRLPVLAVHAVYQTILPEIVKYQDKYLADLAEHSASDLRTKAIGDIEILNQSNEVIEAVEVKHKIIIDNVLVLKSCEKIRKSQVSRYYILSTSDPCSSVTDEGFSLIEEVYKNSGCQIIINGVLPTIRYYLRLVNNPEIFLTKYTHLLINDKRVTREQIELWTSILKTHIPQVSEEINNIFK